jgi:hypothetical protein
MHHVHIKGRGYSPGMPHIMPQIMRDAEIFASPSLAAARSLATAPPIC